MPGKGLLLVEAELVEGRLIGNAAQLFSLPVEDVDVVSGSGRLSKDVLVQGAYEVAFSLASSSGHHSAALLSSISAALRPGAPLTVQEPRSPELTANKVSWESGSKAAISLKKTARPPAVASNAPATWSLDINDDEDLVDDDELLTEEDRKRPMVPESDCGPGGGKKACANCSCGRAEAEAAGVKATLTLDMLENPQSSCGSCGLGDAFRCATCPYRGLPGFEMGKKIELPTDFLTADA